MRARSSSPAWLRRSASSSPSARKVQACASGRSPARARRSSTRLENIAFTVRASPLIRFSPWIRCSQWIRSFNKDSRWGAGPGDPTIGRRDRPPARQAGQARGETAESSGLVLVERPESAHLETFGVALVDHALLHQVLRRVLHAAAQAAAAVAGEAARDLRQHQALAGLDV